MHVMAVPCSMDRTHEWSQVVPKALGLEGTHQLDEGKLIQPMSLLPVFSRPVDLCTS